MAKIEELAGAVASARKAYQDKANTAAAPELRALNEAAKKAGADLAAAIVAGAKPCPSCGGVPHGMLQNFQVDKVAFPGFEIGCSSCLDHGAATPDLDGEADEALARTVKRWNAGPGKWWPATQGRVRVVVTAPGPLNGRILTVEPLEGVEALTQLEASTFASTLRLPERYLDAKIIDWKARAARVPAGGDRPAQAVSGV
jgi:hypothetical protein